MELQVSKEAINFGRKPQIVKGYYPAQVMEIKRRTNPDGTDFVSKFGKQLIVVFAVYNTGEDRKTPTTQMMVKRGDDTIPLTLATFIYDQYKIKDKDEYKTSFTPNSKPTKFFERMGWIFDATKPLNTDLFIRKWVEINVDDYDATFGNEVYKASTIKDINRYEGKEIWNEKPAEINKFNQVVTPPTPEKLTSEAKTLYGANTKIEEVSILDEPLVVSEHDHPQFESLRKLKEDGYLSEEGYHLAVKHLKVNGIQNTSCL